METKYQRLKDLDGTLSLLNAAIDTLNLTRDKPSAKQVKDAFGSAGLLLTTIRVRFLPARINRCWTMTD
jgi:hypothetical protein